MIPTSTTASRRWVALGIGVFPILILVPYTILMLRFNYPDVLRTGADSLLPAFHAGGTPLIMVWFAYAFAILPFLVASIALPAALGVTGTRARLAITFGVVSSVVQLAALLRWTFVVPYLAGAYTDPATTAAGREAVAIAFETQHRLFGVLLGEHVGQLTLAAWTFAIVACLPRGGFARWLRPIGWLAGGLFAVGLLDGLAQPLGLQVGAIASVPVVAFLLWSAWLVAFGIWLWRRPAARTPAVMMAREALPVSSR